MKNIEIQGLTKRYKNGVTALDLLLWGLTYRFAKRPAR